MHKVFRLKLLSSSEAWVLRKHFTSLTRMGVTVVALLALWQMVISLFDLPAFILPSPLSVLKLLGQRYDVLISHTLVTFQEIIFGLLLGLCMGAVFAISMLMFQPLKRWILPIMIISQAMPVFAIAPLLMLWLGYGITSKIVMAAIIIFFPMTTCCYDGLRNTPQGWIDLANTMQATRWQCLRHVQLPAALPAMASGVRVAVVVAPIGAISGEWVGSSAGLGYLMLQANARMQVDEMFLALMILSLISAVMYRLTDGILHHLIPWSPSSTTID